MDVSRLSVGMELILSFVAIRYWMWSRSHAM